MSLRFRVSTRSALGRRLKPLDVSERRDLFQQVVEAGLRALYAEYARSDLEANLDRLFKEVDSQKKDLAAIVIHTARLVELASLGHPTNAVRSAAPSSNLSGANEGFTDLEFQTLVGTLGSIGAAQRAPNA